MEGECDGGGGRVSVMGEVRGLAVSECDGGGEGVSDE